MFPIRLGKTSSVTDVGCVAASNVGERARAYLHENALLPFGDCLRRRGRYLFRNAGRLIADVHAGLQCGIDAYSHHARRRRRHGGHYFFVDRPVGEAMNFSPVALAPQLSSSHQTICG
jgi:hypothetical protein